MLNEGDRRAILLGALFGAASGSLLALLYRRWSRQRAPGERTPIKAGQVMRLGVALMPALRQLAELLSGARR